MDTANSQLVQCLKWCLSLVLLASLPAMAQQDTVEFKLIPKYYPEQNPDFVSLPPPEIVSKPDIVFPADPKLHGKEARVYVNALVNTKGIVQQAKVWKSTDPAFDKYALKHAKQYKFRFTKEAIHQVDSDAKVKGVWVTIPMLFKE